MSVDTYQCPQCGATMMQKGADMNAARYRCGSCGFMKSVSLGEEGNLEFDQRKSDLLARVRLGLVDWRVTQWDTIQKELLDFIARYEAARNDIQLQMCVVACITNGFQMMDADKYKQCKILFKVTEKIYKQQMKMLKQQTDSKLYESVNDYADLRTKYKKCRNDYRNTKLMWKTAFFIFKKIAF